MIVSSSKTMLSVALLSSHKFTRSFSYAALNPPSPSTTTTTTTSSSPTAMRMTPGSVYQQAALGFFGGIRFPASLIAGSSVAAIFSLVQQAKNTDGMSRLEISVLRLYHAVAILSLCLSMVTITTTTTASTLLLLTSKMSDTQYCDVYHFLKAEFQFEFVLTRWAFSSSLVLFLTGVGARILLELDLLKPKRRMSGVLVMAVMMSAISGILSNINLTLNCWPNLLEMTAEVFRLIGQRMVTHRGPLQFISVASMGVAIACLFRLALRSVSELSFGGIHASNNDDKLPKP